MSDQDYVFWIEKDKYCLQCGALAFPNGILLPPNPSTDLIQCPKCKRYAQIIPFTGQECKICSKTIDLKKFHNEFWLCKSCATRFLIKK